MTNFAKKYQEQMYAGVLGKIIGVYLGRPVEGWAYEKIIDTFGDIPFYKHKECGVPLIVADDDISGTFAFFRALEDSGYPKNLTPQDVGNAWLNYIIEDKTILWWGGLGRSTEHTAYLNLKRGIPAPRSGSIQQNGRTLAEQIGAQIFIDAFAMACPGDPDLAVHLVRSAASVSHDGIAVDAACYLAAMEAMAFHQRNLDRLMDDGLRYVQDPRLRALIADVRDICAAESDWRAVRSKLDDKYGYHRYPGCCHMVPNHAMVLASLLLGGDNFQQSVRIAASAGWDTDCNAGNVGCLNGIRLGLSGIDGGADLRTPVADQMYVVCSDGGSVITDAVQQTHSILQAASALHGEELPAPVPRFSFSFPGSIQGFSACPYYSPAYGNVRIGNELLPDGSGRALAIQCSGIGPGLQARVSTPTFLEKGKVAENFSTIASPTLYETQTICAEFCCGDPDDARIFPYILYYDRDDQVITVQGPEHPLVKGHQALSWTIPSTGGMPIFRIGFAVTSDSRFDGTVYLTALSWDGAPEAYRLEGMLMTSIWNTKPSWLQTWASSAKQFQADFKYTVCVSHPEDNGVATIGTENWKDYAVSSNLMFSLHQSGGLVLRCRGHRRYYAAVLSGYNKAQIILRLDDTQTVLAETEFPYQEDVLYSLRFSALGNHLSLDINGAPVLCVDDAAPSCGGAGLLVNNGTLCADGFSVNGMEKKL